MPETSLQLDTPVLYNKENSFVHYILTSLIFLTVFGFPIVLLIPIYIGQETTKYSIIYRAICVFLMIILLFTPSRSPNRTQRNTFTALIIFWFIFLFRIIYDFEFRNILQSSIYSNNPLIIYLFAFFLSFLPIISIYHARNYLNQEKIEKLIFLFALLQSISVLLGLYFNYGINVDRLFFDRSQFAYGAKSIAHPLNPISVGRSGSILFLLGFYNFIIKRRMNIGIFIISSLLGLLLIFIGSSKGPFLTTILVIIIFIMLKPKIFLSKNYLLTFFGFLIILTSMDFLVELNLIRRFSTPDLNEAVLREDIWLSAFIQFLNNPIFGDSIFDHYGMYPHNIYIEVLMATGLIGAIPFFYFLKNLIKKAVYLFKNNSENSSIVVLLLTYLLFSFTSGSLYFSPELWVIVSIVLFNYRLK